MDKFQDLPIQFGQVLKAKNFNRCGILLVIREHLRDVEKNVKDASKAVAGHFNLTKHSKKHIAISGFSLHLGTTESRKNLEEKFIFQIGILNP